MFAFVFRYIDTQDCLDLGSVFLLRIHRYTRMVFVYVQMDHNRYNQYTQNKKKQQNSVSIIYTNNMQGKNRVVERKKGLCVVKINVSFFSRRAAQYYIKRRFEVLQNKNHSYSITECVFNRICNFFFSGKWYPVVRFLFYSIHVIQIFCQKYCFIKYFSQNQHD